MASLGDSDRQWLRSISNDPLAPSNIKKAASDMLAHGANSNDVMRLSLRVAKAQYKVPTTTTQTPPPKNIPTGFNQAPAITIHRPHITKAAPSIASAPKPSFTLHKKGSVPPTKRTYGVDTYTLADKYAGLSDIVREATQRTEVGWGDIADIDDQTGQPVGGALSYLDTSKPEEYDDRGVPYEIPTRTIGVDPLSVPKPYDPWVRTKRKVRAIRKKQSTITVPQNGAILPSGEQWNAIMMDWTSMQQRWNKSLSAQNAQMQSLSESASSIAYSNRFRIARELSKFSTIEGRRKFLSAARIDPDAQVGSDMLSMAEVLYDRDNPGSASKENWDVRNVNAYSKLPRYGKGSLPPGERIHQDYIDGILGGNNRPWIKNVADAAEALKSFTKGLNSSAQLLGQIAGISNSWQKEFSKQAEGTYNAASYFVPKPFKEASSRLFHAGLLRLNSEWTQLGTNLAVGGQLAGALSGGLQGAAAGAAVGGPWGALIGGVGGALPGLVGSIGTFGKGRIKSTGEEIQSRINLWSGISELIIAPFRLVGSAARALWGHLHRLSLGLINVVSKFNELGIPLTMLSSMSYADMQRSYVNDAMGGFRKGSTSSAVENFAGAQMDLYTFGKLNEERVIASAMLGTFGDTYAFGGDAREQYANTINTIFARMQANPAESQRLMNLAGKIDASLPTRLQQMKNLSALDSRYGNYKYIGSSAWQRDRGLTLYTSTELQRARYTQAGMEASALMESMGDSKNQIALRIWDAFGKDIMSGLNDVFRMLATGGSWRDALDLAKQKAKTIWTKIADQFGFDGDKSLLDQIGGKFGVTIAGGLAKALPAIASITSEAVQIILKGWGGLITGLMDVTNRFVSQLGLVHLDVDKEGLKNFLTGKGAFADAISLVTPGSVERDWGTSAARRRALHDAHNTWSQLSRTTPQYDENDDAFWTWRGHKVRDEAELTELIEKMSLAREYSGANNWDELESSRAGQIALARSGVIDWDNDKMGWFTSADREAVKQFFLDIATELGFNINQLSADAQKKLFEIVMRHEDARTGKTLQETRVDNTGTVQLSGDLSAFGISVEGMLRHKGG